MDDLTTIEPDGIDTVRATDHGRRVARAFDEQMLILPQVSDGHAMTVYDVGSYSGKWYSVDLKGGNCTCPDHIHTVAESDDIPACKHRLRVRIAVEYGTVPAPGEDVSDYLETIEETVVNLRDEVRTARKELREAEDRLDAAESIWNELK